MLPVTAAIPVALGLTATTVGLLKGLHSVKKGVEANDPGLRAKGTGEALTALGVALISTGVGVAPGIGLMLGGLAVPLLQRLPWTKKIVSKAVDWTAQKLYPMSIRTEAFLDKASPMLDPVQKVVDKGKKALEPVTKPIKHMGKKAFQLAQKSVRWATGNWVAQAVDDGVGKLNQVLLPTTKKPPEPA